MPQPVSVRARRFYAAFYHWSLLTAPPSASAHRVCSSGHVSRRAITCSTRLRQEAAEAQHPSPFNEGPRIRKHHAPSDGRGIRRTPYDRRQATSVPVQNERSRPTDKAPSAWRSKPVQTSTDRPFSGLKAWEEAIRYRSDSGIMLEVCIPEDRARVLREKYGEKLEVLKKKTGARVEMGETIKGLEAGEVRSMLVSGTFEEAARVRQTYRAFVLREGGMDGKSGEGRGGSRSVPVGRGPAAISPRSSTPLKAYSELPSIALKPWDEVLRAKSETSLTLEFAIPEDRVQGMRRMYGPTLDDLKQKTTTHIDLAEAHETRAGERLHTLTVSGSPLAIERARSAIGRFKNDAWLRTYMTGEQSESVGTRGKPVVFTEEARSHLRYPSERIQTKAFVLRFRAADGKTGAIEAVTTDEAWRAATAHVDLVSGLLPRFPGVQKIEAGEVWTREGEALRSVVIEGAAMGVLQLWSHLANISRRITQQRKQQGRQTLGPATDAVAKERYVPKAFRAGDVASQAQKPFEALAAWGFAIRRRDAEAFVTELAIPAERMAALQFVYGRHLETVASKTGTRLVVSPPSTTWFASGALVSLTLSSATLRAAGEVFNLLRSYRSENGYTQFLRRYVGAPSAGEAVASYPEGEREAAALIEELLPTLRHPRELWRHVKVLPGNEFPKSAADLKRAIVRRWVENGRDGEAEVEVEVEMETLMVEEAWRELVQADGDGGGAGSNDGGGRILRHTGAVVEGLEVLSGGVFEVLGDGVFRRVRVKGGLAVVWEAFVEMAVVTQTAWAALGKEHREANAVGKEEAGEVDQVYQASAPAIETGDDYFAAASAELGGEDGSHPDRKTSNASSSAEAVSPDALAAVIRVDTGNPRRALVYFPRRLRGALVGHRGKNHERILRQSGARGFKVVAFDGGFHRAEIVGERDEVQFAVTLAREILEWAVRKVESARARMGVGGGATPAMVYHSRIVLPGATPERRRALAQHVIGLHGDVVKRMQYQTGTYIDQEAEGGKGDGVFVIRGERREEVAVATRAVDERVRTRTGGERERVEEDGIREVEAWTAPGREEAEEVEVRSALADEEDKADVGVGGLKREDASTPAPRVESSASRSSGETFAGGRYYSTMPSQPSSPPVTTTWTSTSEAFMHFDSYYMPYLTGMRGKTHERLLRQSEAEAIQYRPNVAEEGTHRAEVRGQPDAVKAAVTLITEAIECATVLRPFRTMMVRHTSGDTTTPPLKMFFAKVAFRGGSTTRQKYFAALLLGSNGYGMERMQLRTCTYIDKIGPEACAFVIRGYEEERMEAAVEAMRGRFNQKADLREEERDGLEVVERWREVWVEGKVYKEVEGGVPPEVVKTSGSAGEEGSEVQAGEELEAEALTAIPGTEGAADDADSQPSDVGVESASGRQEQQPSLGRESSEAKQMRRIFGKVVALPDSPPEIRRQVDDFLQDDLAQHLRRIESQTACQITKLKRSGPGVYIIWGPKSGYQRAKNLLQMRIEVKCQMLGLDPQGQRLLLELRAGSDESAEVQQQQLAEDLKAVLRPLTHPAVLITSRMPGSSGRTERPGQGLQSCRGVTVSSFTAVTLHPVPIITFNLKVPSRTWEAMVQSGRLCVHIMAATPEAAAITHIFTRPHEQPDEPFWRLARSGVNVHVPSTSRLAAPRIRVEGDAVLARVSARVLAEKCVHVGDHVVVLAEVQYVALPREARVASRIEMFERLGDAVGLAYANKAYRAMGDAIEPAELSLKARDSATLAGSDAERVPDQEKDDPPLSEEAHSGVFAGSQEGDAVRNASADTAKENIPSDYFGASDEEVAQDIAATERDIESRHRAAIEEEEDYSLGFAPLDAERLQDEVTDMLGHSSATRRWTSASSVSTRPTVNADGQHVRRYHTARHFSTSSPSPRDRPANASATVADPSVLTQTIGEFMGQTGEHKAPGRMRGLLNAKKAAERAAQELEQALADGSLTEERSLQLEHMIAVNERRVTRRLALRAADDLRRMLDTGKVDARLSQWMESAVEKGMVVCVDEARQARAAYDEGQLNEEQFAMVRERLEREHGALNQEAMRLRQFYDEDEEGCVGEGGDAQAPGSHDGGRGERFDGFSGNV